MKKTIKQQLNEALAACTTEQLESFNKRFRHGMSDETALNILESIVPVTESATNLEVINESTRIKKNNGASDNGHGVSITEADPITAKKEQQVPSLMKAMNLNESAARNFLGLKAKTPDGLTKHQASEYHFARAIGLNESDAMVLAKLPHKEPSSF